MPMPATEAYLTHCTAVLDALRSAQVPMIPAPEGEDVTRTIIALRPAFRALRFAQDTQRDLEARLWEDNRCELIPVADTPWRASCVSLAALCIGWVITHGNQRVCLRFAAWLSEVFAALVEHGTYNPATNHQPLPGEELDALERREEVRDLMRSTSPTIHEAFYGKEHIDAD